MEIIPILVFIGPCWLFAGLYYQFGIKKHLNSPSLKTLNLNLAKADLYWSNSEGDFRQLTTDAISNDQHKYVKTYLLTAGFLSLLSILGMIMLVLLFVSGRPRLEHNTFASPLASNPNLDANEVRAHIEDIKSRI